MTHAHRITRLASVLACGGLLVGCVSQQRYDDTETSARSLQARNQELLQENQSLKTTVDQQNAEIAALQSDRANLSSRVEGVNAEMSDLRGSFSSLDTRLQRLRVGLNPATDRALRQLAQQNPNLISYDPGMGMVRFGSDLTFASGSDEVKPAGAQGLQQLARILQTSDAHDYDLRIVGHTDSQRPGRSASRFPTNRHLSVARAIAAGRTLESAGIPGERIEIVGWGPHRPVVPNSPRGGTAENRRVEIFLVASSEGMFTDAAPAGEDVEEVTPQRREYPIK